MGLFDAAVLSRPLPAGSFYALLAECGGRIVHDSDFVERHFSRTGPPSIPPSLAAKVRKSGQTRFAGLAGEVSAVDKPMSGVPGLPCATG